MPSPGVLRFISLKYTPEWFTLLNTLDTSEHINRDSSSIFAVLQSGRLLSDAQKSTESSRRQDTLYAIGVITFVWSRWKLTLRNSRYATLKVVKMVE